MAFINMMEKMVELRMEERYKSEEYCSCEQCIEDIKCIALNNLPPKYVSTTKGELFTKIDQQMVRQNVLDIDVAVINAIEYVTKRPRHNLK
ncbi:MAG: late competence development ComFB family protein [Oscillospiraceae bacterium]|nr:late competence development ComFB family protein [Oscillospiraceae bacterium]